MRSQGSLQMSLIDSLASWRLVTCERLCVRVFVHIRVCQCTSRQAYRLILGGIDRRPC